MNLSIERDFDCVRVCAPFAAHEPLQGSAENAEVDLTSLREAISIAGQVVLSEMRERPHDWISLLDRHQISVGYIGLAAVDTANVASARSVPTKISLLEAEHKWNRLVLLFSRAC